MGCTATLMKVGTSHRNFSIGKSDWMTINLDEHDAMLRSTSEGTTLHELENEKLPTDQKYCTIGDRRSLRLFVI